MLRIKIRIQKTYHNAITTALTMLIVNPTSQMLQQLSTKEVLKNGTRSCCRLTVCQQELTRAYTACCVAI